MNPTLLQDLLIHTAARRPDATALVVDRHRHTYAEIDCASDRLALALIAAGVRRGDRVVVFLENTLHAVMSFWAVLKADAVACPVNPRTRARKLGYCLHHVSAAALIADLSLLDDSADLRYGLAALRVLFASRDDPQSLSGIDRIDLDSVLRGDASPSPLPRGAIDHDLAAILYTSGSSGQPKGVMLTHRNMLAAAQSVDAYLHNRGDDVILCALPLSFDYGLYQMIMAFAVGARLILERPGIVPQRLLSRMRSERVSAFPTIPTQLAMLGLLPAHHLEGLGYVRYVSSTGAHLTPRQIALVERGFPNAHLYSMFGLTECKRCSYLPPSELHRKPGSVGIAMPNTELWVADDQGRRLPPGQVGELVVRGANVMRGYWNDPDETARKLRPGPIDGEHVLHTGDLCRMDEDGYLFFLGRKDDLMKSQGYLIAPKEIETALLGLDGIVEAAVIGEPDELLGQSILAFVVLDAAGVCSAEQIRAHCAATLEPALIPSRIEIRTALPRNSTGKIDKLALRSGTACPLPPT